MSTTFTEKQKTELLALLWDYMRRDREHSDRVHTGYGTKTKAGLIACLERIAFEDESLLLGDAARLTTYGTSYFTSRKAAEKYYGAYEDDPKAAVDRKLASGEIHLGRPPLGEGESLSVIDDGARYAVTTREVARTTNPDCDNNKCESATGEVRVLPTGGSGNAILCHACYEHEMQYRRERNRELGAAQQFKLPKWEDLRVYEVV